MISRIVPVSPNRGRKGKTVPKPNMLNTFFTTLFEVRIAKRQLSK